MNTLRTGAFYSLVKVKIAPSIMRDRKNYSFDEVIHLSNIHLLRFYTSTVGLELRNCWHQPAGKGGWSRASVCYSIPYRGIILQYMKIWAPMHSHKKTLVYTYCRSTICYNILLHWTSPHIFIHPSAHKHLYIIL